MSRTHVSRTMLGAVIDVAVIEVFVMVVVWIAFSA
jgi:hypothetical protein